MVDHCEVPRRLLVNSTICDGRSVVVVDHCKVPRRLLVNSTICDGRSVVMVDNCEVQKRLSLEFVAIDHWSILWQKCQDGCLYPLLIRLARSAGTRGGLPKKSKSQCIWNNLGQIATMADDATFSSSSSAEGPKTVMK